MVVREAEHRSVSEVLNQFISSTWGVRLDFSIVQISDSDDLGTADSLRFLRNKLKVEGEGGGEREIMGHCYMYDLHYLVD